MRVTAGSLVGGRGNNKKLSYQPFLERCCEHSQRVDQIHVPVFASHPLAIFHPNIESRRWLGRCKPVVMELTSRRGTISAGERGGGTRAWGKGMDVVGRL